MKQTNEPGKELVKEMKAKRKQEFKDSVANSTPVLVAKGLWLFSEGMAQLLLAAFAIYEARYGHFPTWGRYSLTIGGVLILVPAAWLLAKFFRNVAKG